MDKYTKDINKLKEELILLEKQIKDMKQAQDKKDTILNKYILPLLRLRVSILDSLLINNNIQVFPPSKSFAISKFFNPQQSFIPNEIKKSNLSLTTTTSLFSSNVDVDGIPEAVKMES